MELMRLKGTNGTIVAYDNRVEIERKGVVAFSTQGFKGNKTFFYSDITSVDYKKPGMVNGYIQFVTAGSNSRSPKSGIMGTSKSTMSDENTVVLRAFNRTVPQKSEELYKLIMEKVSQSKKHTTAAGISGADEIKKYKELMEQGIITEEEFNAKKKQILGI